MRWLTLPVLLVGCGSTGEQLNEDLPITERYRELADLIEAQRVAADVPGIVMLVAEHGEVIFAHGFGSRHPDRQEELSSSTLFRVASVSKQFTAAALLRTGVSLDTTVSSVIPTFHFDIPDDEALLPALTLRHLVTNAGGLQDTYDVTQAEVLTTDEAFDEYMTTHARSLRFQSPPGAFYNYSNTNFVFAGYAIEQLEGVPYREVMARLFDDAGLDRATMVASEAALDGNAAAGLATRGQLAGTIEIDSYDTSYVRPAGGAWMSAWDLWRWMRFLQHGDDRVLPDEARIAMQSPQVPTLERAGVAYGYGLVTSDSINLGDARYELDYVGHSGGLPGFASFMFYLPERDFAVVLLANADSGSFNAVVKYVVEHFAELPAPTALPSPETPPARLAEVAGRYDVPLHELTVELSVVDGALQIAVPQWDVEGEVYDKTTVAVSPDNVVWMGQLVTFIGSGPDLILRSRNFVAKRATTVRTTPARAAWEQITNAPDPYMFLLERGR